MERIKALVPDVSLLILFSIGMIDLVMTAVLHAQGLIVELNPVMKPFIERSEWMFAVIKGATLVTAYVVMMQYARQNPDFVRRASRVGIVLYLGIWSVWFFAAM